MQADRNSTPSSRFSGSLEEALGSMKEWRVPEKAGRDEIWERIEARITGKAMQARLITLRQRTLGIAAAAAIFVIGLAGAWMATNQSYSTQAGQRLQVYLPDSSSVTLNAGTTLSYNRIVYHLNRRLKMEGEAWFEVQEGKSFQVHTPGGSVEALGTSFNVYARGQVFKTHCATGRVAIKSGEGQDIITAGQAAKLQNDKLHTYRYNKATAPQTWTSGRLNFKDEELQTIANELERQFDVSIDLKTAKNRHYTGSFTLQHLDSALQAICKPMGLGYTKRDQTIIITNE